MLCVDEWTLLQKVDKSPLSCLSPKSRGLVLSSQSIVLAEACSLSLINSLERSCIKGIKCVCQCYNFQCHKIPELLKVQKGSHSSHMEYIWNWLCSISHKPMIWDSKMKCKWSIFDEWEFYIASTFNTFSLYWTYYHMWYLDWEIEPIQYCRLYFIIRNGV